MALSLNLEKCALVSKVVWKGRITQANRLTVYVSASCRRFVLEDA